MTTGSSAARVATAGRETGLAPGTVWDAGNTAGEREMT